MVRYTCSCPTDQSTVGDNCNSAAPSESKSGDVGATTTASAVLGSIGAMALLVIVGVLLNARRKRRQPIDMAAVQDEILANLGGTALTFSKDEIGLTMLFTQPPALAGAHSVRLPTHRFGQLLLECLQNLQGLPSRIAGMLNEPGTTIAVSANGAALLTMNRPSNAFKAGAEEKIAALLHRRAAANEIHANNQNYVFEVAVAVPQRVPRELDRHAILRLKVIVR